MSSTVFDAPAMEKSSRRSREHQFFWGMSVLMALIIFIGFAPTYFLAALFHAEPLPAPVVRIHGAVFTSWIMLLVAQTSLAASGRANIHRRLGILGLALAPVVIALGVLVANEMLRRLWAVPDFDAKATYAVALSEILGFAVPVTFAFLLRHKPTFHKRLILIGTIAMMTAGFGRWPLHFLLHKPLPAMMAGFGLLLLLIAYDLVSMRTIHRATALGGTWIVFTGLSAVALSHTEAWQSLATHIHSLVV